MKNKRILAFVLIIIPFELFAHGGGAIYSWLISFVISLFITGLIISKVDKQIKMENKIAKFFIIAIMTITLLFFVFMFIGLSLGMFLFTVVFGG